MKNLYLGYETAKWYWEHTINGAQVLDSCSHVSSFENCASSYRDVCETVRGTILEDKPLHVLTDSSRPKNSQNVVYHCHRNSFPKGSFIQLKEHIFISSPQLSFVQMCRIHGFGQAFMYGCSLCGTYSLNEVSGYGISDRRRIISSRRLKSFVDEQEGLYGLTEARKVSKYLIDNSASPREIAAAGMLTLPLRYGGMGLPAVQLNKRIDIPNRFSWAGKRRYFVADFYWPETKVVIEYDSDVAHAHTYGIYRDSEKRNTLVSMGYTPLCITSVQLNNPSDFALATDVIRRALGLRKQPVPTDYMKRVVALRKELGLPWYDGQASLLF